MGPFDWDDVDSTKPLDFGAFLTKMNALQTGQRIVLLQWAHATSKVCLFHSVSPIVGPQDLMNCTAAAQGSSVCLGGGIILLHRCV